MDVVDRNSKKNVEKKPTMTASAGQYISRTIAVYLLHTMIAKSQRMLSCRVQVVPTFCPN